MINITSKTENTVRLFDSGRQQTNVDRDITEEFNNSLKWADDNQMIINFNKSKEIVFQKCSPHTSLPSVLTGIERVVSAKLLGVIFSHNLKFDEHVEMFKLSVSVTYCNVM